MSFEGSRPVDLATCGPIIPYTEAVESLRRIHPRMDRLLAAPLFTSLIWFKSDFRKTYYVRESDMPTARVKAREWFESAERRERMSRMTVKELIG